jgi:ribosomal protein L16 Arg81 hydroxylase
LIEINPNISKKAFEVLCQRKQTIEELPLEKLEEELHRNLDAVENMLKSNKESPEEFTQWLQETIRNIEATIYYLQTTTQPTALSPLGFDL